MTTFATTYGSPDPDPGDAGVMRKWSGAPLRRPAGPSADLVDGALGTALHVSDITLSKSDAHCVGAFRGPIKAGVADLPTGARDANEPPASIL